MHWLFKAEQKLGRFAIPGLIRIIAGFQLLVFVLVAMNEHLHGLLNMDPERILSGEVWRLVTYVFIPRSYNPFWIIFQVLFLWFISDGLEQAWGSFRVNLYFAGTMITLTAGCFILQMLIGQSGGNYAGEFLYESLFLAFAVIYPNQIIQFMLILPVKIKYLAYLVTGYLVLLLFSEPRLALLIGFAFAPFFIFAGPQAVEALRLRLRVAERRQVYKQHSLSVDEAFHRCAECGKTEEDDAHLEFRVAEDDNEYCVPCLEARKAESAK